MLDRMVSFIYQSLPSVTHSALRQLSHKCYLSTYSVLSTEGGHDTVAKVRGARPWPPSEGQIKGKRQMNQQMPWRKQTRGPGPLVGGQGGLSEDRTMGQEWRRLHKAVRRRDPWRGRSSALFTKGKLVWLEHHGGGVPWRGERQAANGPGNLSGEGK